MLRRLALAVVVLTACSGPTGSGTASSEGDATIGSERPPTTATTLAGTTTTETPTTDASLDECDPIPYSVGTLPSRVDTDRPAPEEIPRDQYTTIPGTRSDLW